MSDHTIAHLHDHAVARREAGLRRTLTARAADDHRLDLAGNDYLGLARHPGVITGSVAATQLWGAGSTGSRLVTGTTELHCDLEREFAKFTGADSTLVFSSGYLANIGAITSLTDSDTLLVSEAQNHASIVDACRLSRARVAITPHRDLAAVQRLLAQRTEPRAVVVTDAVFSVDGDLADLASLATICRDSNALLIVDEAHSLGVIGVDGSGAVAAAGLGGRPDIVVTATLSKAFGSQGGLVLAHADVTAHIIDSARAFIFDTGLAPASVGAAQAALRLLQAEPGLAEQCRTNATALAHIARESGWEATTPDAAVVSLAVGDPAVAVAAARACAEAGVLVGCFRPPSVPDGVSRLRLTSRANLTASDLELVASVLTSVREDLRP